MYHCTTELGKNIHAPVDHHIKLFQNVFY